MGCGEFWGLFVGNTIHTHETSRARKGGAPRCRGEGQNRAAFHPPKRLHGVPVRLHGAAAAFGAVL